MLGRLLAALTVLGLTMLALDVVVVPIWHPSVAVGLAVAVVVVVLKASGALAKLLFQK